MSTSKFAGARSDGATEESELRFPDRSLGMFRAAVSKLTVFRHPRNRFRTIIGIDNQTGGTVIQSVAVSCPGIVRVEHIRCLDSRIVKTDLPRGGFRAE